MALTRAKKERLLEGYGEALAQAPHAFLVSFQGVTVPEATELRARIREVGGSYTVVKNRLALRSAEGNALGLLKDHFRGPTAVAFSADDPVALAKVLSDFAKENPKLEFKAGIVEGAQVAPEQIQEIATLPSREELIARLVYLLQSPITRFVRALGAIPQQFVSVLDQIRTQKEGQG